MNITTWPVRALFKYVFKRVLGTFIKTDLNLDDIDFSAKSFKVGEIELNTYEINKMMHAGDTIPPFKLVNASVKSIDIPWGIFKLGQGTIEVEGIDVILMPCPTRTKRRKKSSEEDITEEKGKFSLVREPKITDGWT